MVADTLYVATAAPLRYITTVCEVIAEPPFAPMVQDTEAERRPALATTLVGAAGAVGAVTVSPTVYSSRLGEPVPAEVTMFVVDNGVLNAEEADELDEDVDEDEDDGVVFINCC